MPSEADTCREHVAPLLQSAGWDNDPHSIAEQRTITDGRIVPLGNGFVRNGIAVYKKITRSDSTAIEAVCRLADLYTVQGQLSDARTYLNQAVEHYQKQGDTAKCVELFEKLLLMDPENAAGKQREGVEQMNLAPFERDLVFMLIGIAIGSAMTIGWTWG